MRAVIKDSIMAIIDDIISAVENSDTSELNKLSNYTIHNSSIFQDADSLSIAIITYALSKILDREKQLMDTIDETALKSFLINLRKIKEALNSNNNQLFRKKIGNIYKTIETLDKKMKAYAQEVMLKSKIKKGTAMFQHGISLSRVAETLDISEWDLMEYVGNTGTIDKESQTGNVMKRINFAKELFGV